VSVAVTQFKKHAISVTGGAAALAIVALAGCGPITTADRMHVCGETTHGYDERNECEIAVMRVADPKMADLMEPASTPAIKPPLNCEDQPDERKSAPSPVLRVP
jgi:hypothetical protein